MVWNMMPGDSSVPFIVCVLPAPVAPYAKTTNTVRTCLFEYMIESWSYTSITINQNLTYFVVYCVQRIPACCFIYKWLTWAVVAVENAVQYTARRVLIHLMIAAVLIKHLVEHELDVLTLAAGQVTCLALLTVIELCKYTLRHHAWQVQRNNFPLN